MSFIKVGKTKCHTLVKNGLIDIYTQYLTAICKIKRLFRMYKEISKMHKKKKKSTVSQVILESTMVKCTNNVICPF